MLDLDLVITPQAMRLGRLDHASTVARGRRLASDRARAYARRMRRRVRWLGGVVVGLVAGCSTPRTAETPAPALPGEARGPAVAAAAEGEPKTVPLDISAELGAIEQNLLDLDFAMRFDIASEGAVASRFVGELRVVEETITLRASGTFEGKPVELSLSSDGERLRGGSGAAEISIPQPPELERAVVIGLARMGLLHNLAMLVGGRPPDHADGGVDTWLAAAEVVPGAKVGPDEPGPEAQRQGAQAMSWQIRVDGGHAGDATLWCDPATNLPLERHVIVPFPSGEMRVREHYTIELLRREG
jgi:hypothetical protein